MKTLSVKAKIRGLTLIEVLVVIFVLAVLATLLLPALERPYDYTESSCMNNQEKIAIAFIMFQGDNKGRFPWQISVTNGGSMEFRLDGHPAAQFKVLSPYFNKFSVFICPADTGKYASANTNIFSDSNVSYFLNVDIAINNTISSNNASTMILSGDRHLEANGKPVNSGLFTYTTNMVLNWTDGFHLTDQGKPWGGFSFADGHAQFVRTEDFGIMHLT